MCKRRVFLAVLILLGAATVSAAQRDMSADGRIEKLEAEMATLQAELSQLKAERARTTEPTAPGDRNHATGGAPAAQEKPDAQAVPQWVRRIRVKGDLRYRHEWTDAELDVKDRNRDRLRARLSIYGQVNEEIDVGFGLASGNNESATGTNQDLSDAFSSKDVWLDLAFFDYQPAFTEGLRVLGGKFANPYFRVGNSDLLFDADVRPEGFAATYKKPIDDAVDFFGTVGGHWVEERRTDADASLWAVQAGLDCHPEAFRGTCVTVGAGYFDYGNTEGKPALGTSALNFRGNNSTGGVYDSDFDIAQLFVEIALSLWERPATIFAEHLKNTRAASGEDAGYLLGACLGKCKQPGDWQLAYNYRDLEADAVIGALAEATFGGGGTAVKGHKIAVMYQLAQNLRLAAAYMPAERTRSNATMDHDVLLVDLKLKF